MKVYLVIDSGGYEGINDTVIAEVCSTIEKAKETFTKRVDWAKCDIGQFVEDEGYNGPDEDYEDKFVVDESWAFEETETSFYASEIGRCSRNWIHIWIEEREVI